MVDNTNSGNWKEETLQVPAGALFLAGTLCIPQNARGMVLFPYGVEGEARVSYTESLASLLNNNGLATLLVELLTPEEKALDRETGYFRENVEIMHQRIIGIADWLSENEQTRHLPICYFGVGVTGAAVLAAAAIRPDLVVTVIAVGARLLLADDYLPRVEAPVLLLSGEQDSQDNESNQHILDQLQGEKKVETIRGSSGNLFEDVNTQEEVGRIASEWCLRHIRLG